MIDHGIVIHWLGSREYIDIDVANIGKRTRVHSTLEWRPAERRFVRYKTTSHIDPIDDGYRLRIRYRLSENPDLHRENLCWGTTTLKLSATDNHGNASWATRPKNAEFDGDRPWELFRGGRSGAREYEQANRVRRESRFRKAVLAIDGGRCVLCGESTVEALEVAHILPTCDVRWDTVNNGIVLRVDLHRLYDAHLFEILPDGRLILSKSGRQTLSPAYRTLLRKARVELAAVHRIQKALKRRREYA